MVLTRINKGVRALVALLMVLMLIPISALSYQMANAATVKDLSKANVDPITNQIVDIVAFSKINGNFANIDYMSFTHLLNSMPDRRLPRGTLEDDPQNYVDPFAPSTKFTFLMLDSWGAEPSVTARMGYGDSAVDLVEGKDYIIEYENNDDIGTATATLVGIGECAGQRTQVNFEIVGYRVAMSCGSNYVSWSGVDANAQNWGFQARNCAWPKAGTVMKYMFIMNDAREFKTVSVGNAALEYEYDPWAVHPVESIPTDPENLTEEYKALMTDPAEQQWCTPVDTLVIRPTSKCNVQGWEHSNAHWWWLKRNFQTATGPDAPERVSIGLEDLFTIGADTGLFVPNPYPDWPYYLYNKYVYSGQSAITETIGAKIAEIEPYLSESLFKKALDLTEYVSVDYEVVDDRPSLEAYTHAESSSPFFTMKATIKDNGLTECLQDLIERGFVKGDNLDLDLSEEVVLAESYFFHVAPYALCDDVTSTSYGNSNAYLTNFKNCGEVNAMNDIPHGVEVSINNDNPIVLSEGGMSIEDLLKSSSVLCTGFSEKDLGDAWDLLTDANSKRFIQTTASAPAVGTDDYEDFSNADYVVYVERKADDSDTWNIVSSLAERGEYRLTIQGDTNINIANSYYCHEYKYPLYCGTASVTFQVWEDEDRIDIADVSVQATPDQIVQAVYSSAKTTSATTVIDDATYRGLTKNDIKAIYPDLTVKLDDTELVEMKDYVTTLTDFSFKDDYTVCLTYCLEGQGLYRGQTQEYTLEVPGLYIVNMHPTTSAMYWDNATTATAWGNAAIFANATTNPRFWFVKGVRHEKATLTISEVGVDWYNSDLIVQGDDAFKTPKGTVDITVTSTAAGAEGTYHCKAHWLFAPITIKNNFTSVFNIDPSKYANQTSLCYLYEGDGYGMVPRFVNADEAFNFKAVPASTFKAFEVLGLTNEEVAENCPVFVYYTGEEIVPSLLSSKTANCWISVDATWAQQQLSKLAELGFVVYEGDVVPRADKLSVTACVVPYNLNANAAGYELYEDYEDSSGNKMTYPMNGDKSGEWSALPHGAEVVVNGGEPLMASEDLDTESVQSLVSAYIGPFSTSDIRNDIFADAHLTEDDVKVEFFYGDETEPTESFDRAGTYRVVVTGQNNVEIGPVMNSDNASVLMAAYDYDGGYAGIKNYIKMYMDWGFSFNIDPSVLEYSDEDFEQYVIEHGGAVEFIATVCTTDQVKFDNTALYMGTAEATFEVVSPVSADDADAKTLADLISKVEDRVSADSDLLRIAEGDSTSAVQHNGSYLDSTLADALDSALSDAQGIMDGVNGVEGAAAVALSQVTAAKDALQQALDAYVAGVKTAQTNEDVFGYVADALSSASEAVESTDFGNADTRIALKSLIAKNDNGYYSASDTEVRASEDECYALMVELARAEAAHKAAEYVAPDPDQPEDPIVPDQPGDGDDDGGDNGDDNNGDNTETPDTPPVVEPDPLPEGYVITSTPVDNGAKMQLAAFNDGVAINDVMFTTKDTEIAHIDSNGLMTFVKPGIVEVTATLTSGADKGQSFGIKVVSAYVSESSDVDTQELNTSVAGSSAKISNLPTNEALGLSSSDKLELSVEALSTSTPTHSAYQNITGKNSYEVQLLLNGEPVHIGGALNLTLPASLSNADKALIGNGRKVVVFHSINGSMVDHQVDYDSTANCVKLDINHFSAFHVALVNDGNSVQPPVDDGNSGTETPELKDISTASIALGNSGPFELKDDPLFADSLEATVTLDGETLPESAYTLDFVDSSGNVVGTGGAIVAPGEYYLRATGVEGAGYTGSVLSSPFTVTGNEVKIDLSEYGQVVLDNVSYAWTGEPIDYGYSVVLPASGETLTLDRDYTVKLMYQASQTATPVEVTEAKNIGYYQIVATGVEDAGFTGSTSATFAVSYDYTQSNLNLPVTGDTSNNPIAGGYTSGSGAGSVSGTSLAQTGDELQALLALVSLVVASAAAAGASTIYRRKKSAKK